jgi:phage gp36-like protein
MGNYTTYTELSQRVTVAVLEKLTKYTSSTSPTLEAYIDSDIIPRAEGRVDGYAAVRFEVPLPANDLCQEWTLTIAEYEVYRRTPGGAVPEKIRQAYEDVLRELRDLAAGKLSIPGTTAPTPDTRAVSIEVMSNTSVFDETNFVGF